MTMLLLNKRTGPFHLAPAVKGGKPRVFAGGTTLSVSDEEGAKLLKYRDIVQIKEGVQVKGPAGATPVPAGTGVSGKAAPVEPTDPKKK
ncbi:MAG: hypothetical protein PHS14_00270 [Elusimicrobia bacterium]|nr:hypothetical protein [Elusimicrobiota bacterium]